MLFEAGINMDVVTLIDNMGRATFLSVSSIFLSMIMNGFLLNFILPNDFTLLQGVLLGSIVGGTSTIAVFSILGSLDKTIPNLSSTKVLLTMESIVSDPICIITSITLIRMILQPGVGIRDGLSNMVSTFILSSILGVLVGLSWSNILNRLRTHPYTYMITLAVLLPLYIIGDGLIGDGAGAITSLAFGLTITNHSFFMERLGKPGKVRINVRRLREFHDEIVFFIKSFFFVYIGAIVTITWKYMFMGFVIALLLMVMRYYLISSVGNILLFTREEIAVSKFVHVPGLAAFVLSQLPQLYDPLGSVFLTPGIYSEIVMPIVLGRILYGGFLSPWLSERELKPPDSLSKLGKVEVESNPNESR